MENKRPRRSFGGFRKKEPIVPVEKKIEAFILRNSRNGYFTKFSTITSKFNISESETWSVVGMLLSEGGLESIHDSASGEMKICEADQKYNILNMNRRRKSEERLESKGSAGGDGGGETRDNGGRRRPNDQAGRRRARRDRRVGQSYNKHNNYGANSSGARALVAATD